MLEIKSFTLEGIEEHVPIHLTGTYGNSRIAKVWLVDHQHKNYAVQYGSWDEDSPRTFDIYYRDRFKLERDVRNFLFGFEVSIGMEFDQEINQAYRDCVVTALPKTNRGSTIRIEYEMPASGLSHASRKAFRFGSKLFYNEEYVY